MNKEELDIWLKHFADKPTSYQMFDENGMIKEINFFIVFRYLKELQQKVNQLEEELNNPLRCIFAQVTDDELLRSNALNYAENKELKEKVNQLESAFDEIRAIVSKSLFKTDLVELCRMKNQIEEILDKVGGSNV